MDNVSAERAAARRSLAQLHEDLAGTAPRIQVPTWYHLASGLPVAFFVYAFSLPEDSFEAAMLWTMILTVPFMMLRPLITGTRAEPMAHQSSRATFVQFGVVAAIGLTGIVAEVTTTAPWGTWVLGASAILAFVATVLLSRRAERAFVGSVRAGA